jgi:hypothetical protein
VTDERAPAWRRWLRVTLVVLACLGITVSALGVWIRAVLLDTSTWVATVDDIPSEEAVAAELATYLTEQVFLALDAEQRVSDALPDQAQPLAQPLTAAVKSFIQDEVEKVILSPQFSEIWVAVNEQAHKTVVQVIRGGGDVVSTDDGTVTLNVIPIVNQVLTALSEKAGDFFGFDGQLPTIENGEIPDDLRQKVEQTLDVELPDDFGQIVVFESDALSEVQDAVKLFDDFIVVLAVLSLAAIGGAVALAADRRGVVVRLALGSAAGFLVLLLVIRIVKREVVGLFDDPEAQEAVAELLATTTQLFVDALRTLTVIALLVALVLWLVGPGTRAERVRGWVGGRLGATETGQSVGTWISDHRDLLRIAGAVLAFALVFLLGVQTWLGVLAILGLLVAYEAALGFVGSDSAAASRDA